MAQDDPPLPSPDPGELLARAMATPADPTGGGRWVPPDPAEVAVLLPQYRIGYGGMGAVYRGVQTALDRPIALKLLPLEVSADATFADRFEREARTLARAAARRRQNSAPNHSPPPKPCTPPKTPSSRIINPCSPAPPPPRRPAPHDKRDGLASAWLVLKPLAIHRTRQR